MAITATCDLSDRFATLQSSGWRTETKRDSAKRVPNRQLEQWQKVRNPLAIQWWVITDSNRGPAD